MVEGGFKFLAVIFFLSSCGLRWVQDRVPPPAVKEDGKVLFQIVAPSAKSVFVAGEFNGWEYLPSERRAIPLKKGEAGIWRTEEDIPSGRYQYKYVLDSYSWILDPHNPLTIDDGRGNVNSLLIVR